MVEATLLQNGTQKHVVRRHTGSRNADLPNSIVHNSRQLLREEWAYFSKVIIDINLQYTVK